ncbi:molybdopterin-synthase adenylyltransferase MoeB [Pseudoalteromonas rubra]|uniref:Molybdopterin-synthase adenylyltransferase MoeB n=1 Tax=Pseudoalteromonas rubra TaxID=43658 RepID=A0A5S3WND3_9GAMM|nr:molybdopterin-synthase adenylyltransferase MoeB [Pseudoalteromonas rubra]TMP29089.1 molybdopterin-synthase adenylyltransferase MoeB [Pseudoalteromonas rubra]TMP33546.1 molybdopterin-synthase adenylyltransferase MoeB [Pseudoalteromonas rubra]
MKLDDTNTMRYCRHILLPLVQEDGQEAFLQSHIVVVGAGGLGCAVLPYLAASGVGTLTVFDHDQVDITNLQRQILHCEHNVGKNKAQSAAESLNRINSSIRVNIFETALSEVHSETIKQADVVVDCSDNLQTRLLLNDLCWRYHTPLISGSAIRLEGQVIHFPMRTKDPCYACVASLFGEQSLSCMEAGVLSPVVGTIGTLQATEALKSLLKLAPDTVKLTLYDAQSMQFRAFDIPKRADCPTCSGTH